jgi:hypothetical protein
MRNAKYNFKTVALAAVALAGLVSARPSKADIIFIYGTNPPTINVTFDMQPDNTLIKGSFIDSQASYTKANFTSDELLHVPSFGQSRVEATDGGFDNIGIFLDPGFTFTKLEANPYVDGYPAGTLDVIVTANDGVFTFTYNVGQGNNRFSVEALNGEVIERVDLVSSNTQLHDLRQVRMLLAQGGGGNPPPPGVPEPGAMAMMVGVAVPGVGLYMRKRRASRS